MDRTVVFLAKSMLEKSGLTVGHQEKASANFTYLKVVSTVLLSPSAVLEICVAL